MDDLISRQDALRPFCINTKGERIPERDCDNFPVQIPIADVKKTLRALPSAEPHWIPCSERLRYRDVHLPSEEEDVLICFKDADEYCYDVATFYRDDDPIDGGEAFESESRVYELDEVLAWMPLPEPYKEKDNEHD